MSPLVYISVLVLATLTYGQDTGRRGTNNVVIKLPALFGNGPNTRVIVLPDPSNSRSSSSIRWTGEAKGPVAVDNQVTRRRDPANRLGIQTRPNISPVSKPFIPQTQRQNPQETAGPNTRYQVYNQNSRQLNTRQNQQANLKNHRQAINQQHNRQEPSRQPESQNQNQPSQQSTDRQNQNRVSVTNRGSINNVATPSARTPQQPAPKESIFFNPESPKGGKPVANTPNNIQTGNNNQEQLANPSSGVRERPNFVPAASLFVPAKNQGKSNLATNQGLNQESQSQTTQQGTSNQKGSSPQPNNNKAPNTNNPNKIQYVGNLNVGSVPAVNPQLLAGNAPDRRTDVKQPQQNNANKRSGFPRQEVPRPGQTNNTPSMSQIDKWIAANFPELMNRNTGLPASPALRNIRTRIETMTAGREVNPGPQPPTPAAQAPPPTDQNVGQPAIPQNVVPNQNIRVTGNVRTNNQQQTNTRGTQGNGQNVNRLPGRIQVGTNRPPNREDLVVDAPPVNNPGIRRRPQTSFVQRENVNPNLQTNFLPTVNQIQGRTNLPRRSGINENTSNRGPSGMEGGVLGNQNTIRNSNPSQGQTVPQGSRQFRPNNMPVDVEPNLSRNPGNQNLGGNPGINQGFQQVPNGAPDPPSQAGGTLPPQFMLNAGNPGVFNNQWMAGSPPARPNPGSTNDRPSLPPSQGGMNPAMFNLFNRLPGSQNEPPRVFPVLPGNRGGLILPNPALLGNIPPVTPEPTEAPEVEAGGVVEVEATQSPINNAAILNWARSMSNPLQNPNARGTNLPLGPNGRVNTQNPASGNWFDQLPRLPGWSNRQIDPFQQQPSVNPIPPPSSNFPFQQQAPPNMANGGLTPSRSQRPTVQQRNPVQPQNQNRPADPQAGPDQGPLGNQMRARANQPTPPSQRPRNENARVQPAWKPPTAQPKPTNPPTRQTQNQATNRPSPKPVQGAWTPPVKQTTRNTNRPSILVNRNQPTANQPTSGQGRQRPVNSPAQQPAVDSQNRSSLQPAWQPPSSGQQNINSAIPGQQQILNGMGLFPNANMQGNNQGIPSLTLGGMPPHLANMAIHRRLLDQACGPSKIAQQNYQRQYMAFLGAQQRRRQAQMAMFQRQSGAAAQNPLFQQGVGGAAQNPLFPQGPASSTGQTATPRVRRKRQSAFFPMPGMSSGPGRQQMPGMAQFPGMPQMPGMAAMAGMMPMVAPESPEINYQCTVSESCGMTTQERAQTVHRSPQAERDCQSRKTGLICCLG